MIPAAKNRRVIVAMSGGVDSSVCAWLLKERGFEPVGVTIKTWGNHDCRDERSKGCCSLRDIDDARAAARRIGIPYYVMDLSSDFKEKVIDNFVDEYLAGRTPNPCIRCNREIKFGILLDKARELDAAWVATGHYASIGFDESKNRYFIREGADRSKDQSYVLFGLTQEQLCRTLLPLGELQKKEVRRLAERIGLRVFDKPDSQEICFVKTNYIDFVRQYAPEKLPGRGAIVSAAGARLGEHFGSHEFTIGQRRRIRITHPTPYFVTEIRAEKNEVVVGEKADLYAEGVRVRRVQWQLGPAPGEVYVKLRYRHHRTAAMIREPIGDDDVRLTFKFPQRAVTPGQAAVFYDAEGGILGGGWIHSPLFSVGVAQPGRAGDS